MADVPDQLVAWSVEDVVQRDRQLNDAEPGREVAADLADDIDHAVAQFLSDLWQLLLRQLPQLRGAVDPIQ
jgi:hypothetical protein